MKPRGRGSRQSDPTPKILAIISILFALTRQKTKRCPSPRCASAIQIVRSSQSKADMQPNSHPALPRLSAIISQQLHRALLWIVFSRATCSRCAETISRGTERSATNTNAGMMIASSRCPTTGMKSDIKSNDVHT